MLADTALWLTQDEKTGALRTSQRAAGLIIAAAVLADLIGSKLIDVTPHHVVVIDWGSPAGPDANSSFMAAQTGAAGRGTGRPITTTKRRAVDPLDQKARAQAAQRPDPPTASLLVTHLDPLHREVLAQISYEPDLPMADVIVGLANDIRTRVAHRLIIDDRATRQYRWRSLWRRELVAVAKPHDLSPLSASTATINKIIHRAPLTSEETLLMQLVMHSSLGNTAIGYLNPATIDAALGPPEAIDDRYRPLLLAAITLLGDLAIAR